MEKEEKIKSRKFIYEIERFSENIEEKIEQAFETIIIRKPTRFEKNKLICKFVDLVI